MWIEYIIIGLLAYFVSGHLAKMCAFRVVQPGDRPIFIIFAIQTFTVIWQVAFASVIGVYHGHGFTANFIPDYLMTYCTNNVSYLYAKAIKKSAASDATQRFRVWIYQTRLHQQNQILHNT